MPASVFDLTTVETVQKWLGGATTTTDTVLLQTLITSASRLILATLGRGNILPEAVTDTVDGLGGTGITLRRWPVLSVASVTVCGTAISKASGPTDSGKWLLSPAWDGVPPARPQMVRLVGSRFPALPDGVSVAYTAGYQATAEAATIPATSPYQVQVEALFGPWASDVGVTKATGAAMAKVASAPAAGQYSVLGGGDEGVYQFAAADAGTAVLITYGFVPMDLVTACMETVAERYKYKDRIGQTAQSIGGQETGSYSIADLSPHVKALIQPYKRVHI